MRGAASTPNCRAAPFTAVCSATASPPASRRKKPRPPPFTPTPRPASSTSMSIPAAARPPPQLRLCRHRPRYPLCLSRDPAHLLGRHRGRLPQTLSRHLPAHRPHHPHRQRLRVHRPLRCRQERQAVRQTLGLSIHRIRTERRITHRLIRPFDRKPTAWSNASTAAWASISIAHPNCRPIAAFATMPNVTPTSTPSLPTTIAPACDVSAIRRPPSSSPILRDTTPSRGAGSCHPCRDRDGVVLQRAREVVAGKLAALIGIENLRPAVLHSVLQGLDKNSAPSVFDSRHARPARLTQSMITTR